MCLKFSWTVWFLLIVGFNSLFRLIFQNLLVAPMKANFYNRKKIKYLNMLNSGKPKRNNRGEIVKDAIFQSRTAPLAQIESTRSLFNDSKIVSQNDLELYRNSAATKSPYEVLLSTGNVPYSMISNELKTRKKHDLSNCFGTRNYAKKPCKPVRSFDDLLKRSSNLPDLMTNSDTFVPTHCPGRSKRAWNELYKVLDSSDVIVHLLDARDPFGTLCTKLEEYVDKQAKHKHLIYLLNKVDLVPTGITAKWLRILSKKHTALAFHAGSLENNYGKQSLINMLKQLKNLYNKPSIGIGFVGYPNVGKSSVINVLRDKKVCKAAPVPGETKVWQYVTLMNGIYLIDSPGVIPVADYKQAVLRGAVRVENLEDPDSFIGEIVNKAGKAVLEKTYKVEFNTTEELLENMAKKYGRVMKGGVPNLDHVAKHILYDWLRGDIPYYVQPPEAE